MPSTYLFVPGNRPERFSKAFFSGADRVILDLEDAVAPQDKPVARSAIAAWLATLDEHALEVVMVRINAATSIWFNEDLAWLSQQPLAEVMLSQCEHPEDIALLRSQLNANSRVMPLIETVRGVMGLGSIATAPGVSRLAFGSIDYQLDLDLPGPGLALDTAGVAISMASRAAELPKPVAGVTPELNELAVTNDMQHARELGFGAKLCIHPKQVKAVRKALAPDEEEVAWARSVTAAWETQGGLGALQVDGKMVDRPVLLKAQRILAHVTQAI
jgi:citrate lyase subunit beta / citryl-CoA lyase